MDEQTFLGVTFLTEIVILIIVFVGAYFIFKPVLKKDRERRAQVQKEIEEAKREQEKNQSPPTDDQT